MTIETPYKLRDEILNELNKTYAPEFEGTGWFSCRYTNPPNFSLEMNMQLVTDILAIVAFCRTSQGSVRAKVYERNLFREIVNIIWACYSGGTTAEGVANRICKILNVEVE